MSISLTYRSGNIYELLMRFLYGKNYTSRYYSISRFIPADKEVLDVCCGDCALYKIALKGKVRYTGLDTNPNFVKVARQQSIEVLQLDVLEDKIPQSDYVVMQASLYQFIPNHKKIVDKLLESAKEKVIISEPVRNLASSNNFLLSFLGKYAVNPGTGNKKTRFNDRTLVSFFNKNYCSLVEHIEYINGQREMVIVMNAARNNG